MSELRYVHCSNCGRTDNIDTLDLSAYFCPDCGERNELD